VESVAEFPLPEFGFDQKATKDDLARIAAVTVRKL
jgi:hypothetical protein